MLPEGLILDQDLALFGISIFPATGQSLNQLLSINNCVQPDFKNYTHILSHIGAVCSGKPCLVWEGYPAGKTSVSFPE